MNIRFRVVLTDEEQAQLQALLGRGKGGVRTLKRAQILLAAHAGISDDEMARVIVVGSATVYRTKRRFVEGGLDAGRSMNDRAAARVASSTSATRRSCAPWPARHHRRDEHAGRCNC